MQNMDALEIASILANELFCHQLASFEGLNSGVPTLTTGTITQTQLRNFEQTYIELNNFREEQANHARFVPPSLTNNNYSNLNTIGYAEQGPMTALHVSPGPLSASGDSSSSPGLPAPRRRNMGGRRPARPPSDATPEEEERRSVRRERNKMAAARCRKRRLDRTNELQDETEQLEAKRQELHDQYRKLQDEREQLDAILQNHLVSCVLGKRSISPPDVKPFEQNGFVYPDGGVRVKVEPVERFGEPTIDPNVLVLDNDLFTSPITDKRMLLSTNPVVSTCSLATPPVLSPALPPAPPPRRPRPTSLHVPLPAPAQHKFGNTLGLAGIEISTPSNGAFNFDSLMEGGTGLTPVHPQPTPAHPCSLQQRNAPEVASPGNSLVTL